MAFISHAPGGDPWKGPPNDGLPLDLVLAMGYHDPKRGLRTGSRPASKAIRRRTMRRHAWRSVLVGLLWTLVLSGAARAQGDGRAIVLDTASSWRYHFTLRTPIVSENGAVREVGGKYETTFPPDTWTSPDFDDSSWLRKVGVPFASWSHWRKTAQMNVGFVSQHQTSPALALLCCRGKFVVADATKAKGLQLSLTYRGGAVVYVNGKEIARGHLPKDGDVKAVTAAEIYPVEAYLSENGKLMGTGEKNMDRLKTRLRSLNDIPVPPGVLKTGTNVLAIELHRSPIPKQPYDLANDKKRSKASQLLDACGIVTVRLSAQDADGLTPNAIRPEATQAWNSDVFATDVDTDWGDPTETLRPVRIVGARNGAFSGKVCVGSRQPIEGIALKAADLKSKDGGTIAARQIRARYAAPDGSDVRASRFDRLFEAAPAEVPVYAKKDSRYMRKVPGSPKNIYGSVAPVWITVDVPADAKPGDYEGTLALSAGGHSFDIPVELAVHGYRLPDPKEYRTFIEYIQSPETIAMVYKVPLWSEKHWALIEKSLSLMGSIGAKTCYIPLICQTNQGNAESMVRWIKKGENRYQYDFTLAEKYLDLVQEHLGNIPVVCLYVWEVSIKGETGPKVTVVDGGKIETVVLPKYSDPASKALWSPLVGELLQRLKKRGLEKSIMLGMVTDTRPTADIVSFWTATMPGIPWVREAHTRGRGLPGARHGYTGTVWDRNTLLDYMLRSKDAEKISGRGWNKPELSAFFARDTRNTAPIPVFRMMPELCTFGGQRGAARIGADFWSLKTGGQVNNFSHHKPQGAVASDGRFPDTSWRNLNIRTALLAAGPEGAIASARFEMMREGVQECEARIFIEKALFAGKIGGDLAKRCKELLLERNKAIFTGFFGSNQAGIGKNIFRTYSWASGPQRVTYMWYLGSGWQERSDKLYSAAAEVAKKLGQR